MDREEKKDLREEEVVLKTYVCEALAMSSMRPRGQEHNTTVKHRFDALALRQSLGLMHSLRGPDSY